MNKTALIIAYFGPIPSFINLFLKGCEYNKDIDFLFFTDWDCTKLPMVGNVSNIPFTLQKFNETASKKCGIKINVNSGYKLCDLKPAWPHIFEDYVVNYDFVGYCDIDLIFGQINHFFTNEIKETIDIFTITTEYLSGAFTIFRNTPKVFKLYQCAAGWREIFQGTRHFAFDEYLRVNPIGGGNMQSFSDLVFKTSEIKLWNKKYIGYEKRPNLVTFDHGLVYAENQEWIFFHYVVAKQTVFWTLPDWKEIPDKFYVNKYGFYRGGEQAIGFINLLLIHNYRKQLVAAFKKKLKTIKQIVKNMDVKLMLNSIKKQFK